MSANLSNTSLYKTPYYYLCRICKDPLRKGTEGERLVEYRYRVRRHGEPCSFHHNVFANLGAVRVGIEQYTFSQNLLSSPIDDIGVEGFRLSETHDDNALDLGDNDLSH